MAVRVCPPGKEFSCVAPYATEAHLLVTKTAYNMRPFSAAAHTGAPSASSTIPTRCISASPTTTSGSSRTPPPASSPHTSQPPFPPQPSASLTRASSLSTPWAASSAVAARSTRSKEPNLSDTLANTITTDMAVLRRRPSAASASHGLGTPPKSRAATLRASSARPHSSAAAAIAAAALPAATLPRRPASAASSALGMTFQPNNNPGSHLTQFMCNEGPSTISQDTERRDRSPRHTPRSARPGSAATFPGPSSAVAPSRSPNRLRPSTAAAAPAAAGAAARPPSPSHRAAVPLSRTVSASSAPPARTSPRSSPQPRPASHTTTTTSSASPSRPHPTFNHTAPSRCASAMPNARPGSAAPVPSAPAASAQASTDLGSSSGKRHVVRNNSSIGFRDVLPDGWAKSTAAGNNQAWDDSQAKQRATAGDAAAKAAAAAAVAQSPSRPLPQWSVNARPFEDMLQFEGKDREGFDTVAGRQGGDGVGSGPAGSSSTDVLRPETQDQELPVGAVATAIFLAQTTGSMEGLRGLRISHLPTQMLQYLQTEGRLITGSLDLSRNDLASLAFLRHTPSITSLLLAHNRLVALPAPVFNPVPCLQALDLSNNKLEDLPSSLGSLRSLRHLDASHNNLEVLPARFSELTSLVTLKLNHNRLFCLPQGIGSLTSLEYLAAVGNNMTGLPPTLGCCSRISVLELQQNKLTALPNGLKGLHTWLLEMHLDDNGFTVLPREVALLTKLTNLTLSGNPLLFPPQAVARGGAEAVREFLAVYSTPGTSTFQFSSQDGEEVEQDTSNLDQKQGSRGSIPAAALEGLFSRSSDNLHHVGYRGGLPEPDGAERKAGGGYQPHERTCKDVVASTHVQCQGYNPEMQGSLLLHMQFEAEEHERQMRQMQLKVASSEERAAIAERDAAELAETLRRTVTEGNVTPRPGTVYEQGSAELARAVRVLEAELRETRGELCMSEVQCLRERVLMFKLESSAAAEAARAREAALQDQIAQLEASLEASRMTMRDMTDSQQAAARVLQVAQQPANFFACSYEQEAEKRRRAILSGLFKN
ncbi:hypothetical protein DUNSADRAFT_3300 [Dunaliella salina]|uniref:Disease resistance R13L4/SHOC-2-like LRR domain-containing protein n=1 Tax=Dunaliella salina TaxID=3046 RepID=A0ABQ7GUH7_DUNSA|nr:hypothetical protein DUNSADRAFT_3300 [Dunaliella salina]|eukprot:KAF5838175.1 hypothetical protein DUNSADRAFT_3300 [Dunaliella salina]